MCSSRHSLQYLWPHLVRTGSSSGKWHMGHWKSSSTCFCDAVTHDLLTVENNTDFTLRSCDQQCLRTIHREQKRRIWVMVPVQLQFDWVSFYWENKVFSRLRDDFFYVASWTSNILSMVDLLIGWNPISLELFLYYQWWYTWLLRTTNSTLLASIVMQLPHATSW